MNLTEFLLARIAEELAVIEERRDHRRTWPGDSRASAECEVKRRIVSSATEAELSEWERSGYVWVLLELATIYADHPDYQQEWRP